MPLTEYACPLCTGDEPGQIGAGNGALTCQKNPAHVWNDVKTFRDLNPQMKFKVAATQFPAQVNHVKYEVLIPIGIKTQLETKFGPKANATVTQVLQQLVEGNVVVVGESDLKRMFERFNKRPESSGEIFGMMYSLDMDATNAKDEAERCRLDLLAYEGRNPGCVIVNLGDNFKDIQTKAQEANMPTKMWVEEKLKMAMENNWF